LQGIITEIKEELGVDVKANMLTLFKTIKTEDDFVDLYYLKADININDVKVQEEEVERVKWFSQSEIDNLIKDKLFLPEHIKFYIEIKNQKSRIKK
jgi:8-oxo-dGTP pyrophosphatase MutT (NUDIX family)